MTKASAIVPHKPLELPAAMARAEDLLRLWSVDLEIAPPEEVRPLCLDAIAAIRSGQPAVLAAAIMVPATRREVVLAVDELVAAFPGMRKDADLSVFTRVLAEELMVEKPSHAALRGACRGLIRTATFPPSIAEIIAAVAVQKGAWESRAVLLDRLPRRAADAARALGEAL